MGKYKRYNHNQYFFNNFLFCVTAAALIVLLLIYGCGKQDAPKPTVEVGAGQVWTQNGWC